MATFQTVRYKTDAGQMALMRVDTADLAVDGNAVPAGVANFRIYNRRSSRKIGLSVRRLVLRRVLRPGIADDGIPTQYKLAYVTILDPVSLAAYSLGDSLQYRGQAWDILDYQDEK